MEEQAHKINKLQLVFKICIANKRTSVIRSLYVDACNFSAGYVVDLRQLSKSIYEDGIYDILTCSCGETGCAGIFEGITVNHTKGQVYWDVTQPEPEREFYFNQQQYREAIICGLEQGWHLIKSSNSVSFGPFGFARKVFCECIQIAKTGKLGRCPIHSWRLKKAMATPA